MPDSRTGAPPSSPMDEEEEGGTMALSREADEVLGLAEAGSTAPRTSTAPMGTGDGRRMDRVSRDQAVEDRQAPRLPMPGGRVEATGRSRKRPLPSSQVASSGPGVEVRDAASTRHPSSAGAPAAAPAPSPAPAAPERQQVYRRRDLVDVRMEINRS